ncbi:hypothetical protein FACS18945_5110 [Bacteroidia bacterium]|nr:hypothetical protein FACS18945_5110 [Bacteroidia bacterium]
MDGEHTDKSPKFANMDEIRLALANKAITLHTPIVARFRGERVQTAAGRMILGELLPNQEDMPFSLVNQVMTKKVIEKLLAVAHYRCGDKNMILIADSLKNIGFEQAVRSGISIGMDDVKIPEAFFFRCG